MTSPQRLYHLALRDLHAAAGSAFVSRLGWSLPAHYGDPAAEHAALRGHAAIFDRSHRARFIVSGTDASDVLSAVFAGHVDELEEGRAMRTVALNDRGEIDDLVLIARTGGISYLVTGEPTRRAATFERLNAAVGPDFDVRIDDRTETTCLIALAGPAANEMARRHLNEGLPAVLQPMHNVAFEFHGFRALGTRTSDVGEDGFELMLAPAVAQHVIETLRAAGIPLAGFEAQEAARVEACVPAFSPDLEPGLSPGEADLDILLDIPGGHERWMLSAVLIDGPPPAAGTRALLSGAPVGELRSSVSSPSLNATIGLAVIESRVALPGTRLDLEGTSATIVAKPFYRRRS